MLTKNYRYGYKRLKKIVQVMEYCRRNGVKIPKVIRTTKTSYTMEEVRGNQFSGSFAHIRAAAEEIAKAHRVLANIHIFLTRPEHKLYETLNSHAHVPKQLIHGDLHPQHFIFQGKTLVAILDWDFLHFSERIRDVSFAAFRLSGGNHKKAKAFIETYQKANPLTREEIKLLNDIAFDETAKRLFYIVRSHLMGNDEWWCDFDKQVMFLKKLRGEGI